MVIGGNMSKEIYIVKETGNTFYLVQKINALNIYDRAKMITEFLEKETKKLEYVLNSEIKAILRKKGISILSCKENDYKHALDTLKTEFHETIDIIDVYKGQILEKCEQLGVSPNGMTVVMEDNAYLQCGCEIKVVEIVWQ